MDQFMKEVGGIVAPKEEYEDAVHPYEKLEKAKVLQDARIFHDSILVRDNPRKCCRILAQILYLQNDARSPSSKLTRTEATDLFFASTKLFVDVEDASLRRLVYLFIKEIQPLCDPSDVIIVTSCLTKDMTCEVGLYRANAIRVLVNIIDSAMLGSIERYIKQAIIDNDLQVSNAALVSACHLFDQSSDNAAIVRRWIGEVQEMLMKQSSDKIGSTSNYMVQANAMRLMCQMKSHDRLGVAKLVQKFSGLVAGESICSPLAIVILIRLGGKLLREELTNGHVNGADVRDVSSLAKLCFDFLESSLSHPDDMISYEAARIICTLPNLGTSNLSRSMDCFRGMLASDKPAKRFAAVRTLSAVTNARAVALCNEGLERCIDDDNKQIATFAVTTLLETGNEATIDRILGNLSKLLAVTQDEYKIAMLESMQQLCHKYPSKHRAIVAFLANILREEGAFEFKRSIVNSIISLIRQVPETTESSLLHLCEFIDDCEYSMLSTHTIHNIAELAGTTSAPSQYIRFIYNRVILENSTIRAAAIAALSKMAASCPSLRSPIMALLKHSLNDEDDESRDRAAVAVSVLKKAMDLNPYLAPVIEEYDDIVPDVPSKGDLAALIYLQPLPMSFKNLECSIRAYIHTPGAMESADTLSFAALPIIEDTCIDEVSNNGQNLAVGMDSDAAQVEVRDPAAAIYTIPELADLGRVFRSSSPISLTEEETEYVVKCVKHILDERVILQFIIQNTVEDQRLEDVVLDIESDSDTYAIIGDVPAEKVEYGKTVSAFTVLQRHATKSIQPVCFSCQLNFSAVQVDPDSGEPLGDGCAEEYQLEDLLITPSDYMAKIGVTDFRQAWNGTDDSNESLGKFTMPIRTLDGAASSLMESLGMAPCDRTGQLPPGGGVDSSEDRKQHMLHLSGRFLGGHEVLARAQLTVMPGGKGTLLRMAVRSDDEAVSEAVMSCIT